ncbi:WecB/TagA/CpsF family glycosyltransferase, partial [Myxococcota bacterium]
PLVGRAAQDGWRSYFLGAPPGVAQRAAEILSGENPNLDVAGVDAPPLGFESDPTISEQVLSRIRDAQPQIVLVALGCPKQELWMHQHRQDYAPAVAVGIGASIEFVAGTQRRAPMWMSRAGMEWLYRLAKEPRRMAKRYIRLGNPAYLHPGFSHAPQRTGV